MLSTFPITFEVPDAPEPVALVREWALGLRGLAPGAGGHYEVPTDLEVVRAIRVQVPKGIPNEMPVFQSALELLCAVDLWCLRQHGHYYPSLYDSVCYRDKVDASESEELWDSTAALYQRGIGVCEDLACHRVAERRLVGDWCEPMLIPHEQVDGVLFHVVVRDPSGYIEDPSLALGMAMGSERDATSPRCRTFLQRPQRRRR